METLNTEGKLDAFLAEIEPTLPAGVYLGRLVPEGLEGDDILKCLPRYLFSRSGMKVPPPNPIGVDILNHVSYDAVVAGVELYVKVDAKDKDSAWLYSVNFVVDDLLTKDEVRSKLHRAASIIVGYLDQKFECGDLPVDTAGRPLTEDERTGEVTVFVEEQ